MAAVAGSMDRFVRGRAFPGALSRLCCRLATHDHESVIAGAETRKTVRYTLRCTPYVADYSLIENSSLRLIATNGLGPKIGRGVKDWRRIDCENRFEGVATGA